MPCDHCGERPAAIHLTQIVNNQLTKQHLCEVCAAAKGIQTEGGMTKYPLTDLLATLGSASEPVQGEEDAVCPNCTGTLQDFRDTGRLGCPACYDAFGTSLRTLLRRLHGSSRHIGQRYVPPGGDVPGSGVAVEGLREQLRTAVAAEDFERAAELRDRIRELE